MAFATSACRDSLPRSLRIQVARLVTKGAARIWRNACR